MQPEPSRLTVRGAGEIAAVLKDAGVLLRVGSPVHVFVANQIARALAFRARPTPKGVLIVTAAHRTSGTFASIDAALAAGKSGVTAALDELDRERLHP